MLQDLIIISEKYVISFVLMGCFKSLVAFTFVILCYLHATIRLFGNITLITVDLHYLKFIKIINLYIFPFFSI